MIGSGGNRSTLRRICPVASLSSTNTTWTGLESNANIPGGLWSLGCGVGGYQPYGRTCTD